MRNRILEIVAKAIAGTIDITTATDSLLKLNEGDVLCSTCKYCELYEDENTLPSNTYICNLTDSVISDIHQDYCKQHVIN